MEATPLSPGAAPGTAGAASNNTFFLSLIPPEEPPDKVKVYNPSHVATLRETLPTSSFPSGVSSVPAPRLRAMTAASAEEKRKAEWRSINREIMRRKQAEQLQRTLARHRHGREKKKEEEHAKFEELYSTLVSDEQGFVCDVKEFLKTQARHEVRKRETLHREWDEAIYQKVQADIDAQLAKRSVSDISARRYALMDDYVRVSNTKAYGLFRDIIIPEEYDPMVAHDNGITYDPRLRFDPCKLELRMHAEAGTLDEAKTGFQRKEEQSHRFPPTMWDKLEATPHGRFNKMMAAPMSVDEAATFRSSVVNDHFDIQYGKAVIDREFPKGKRCFPGAKGSADNVQLGEDYPPPVEAGV